MFEYIIYPENEKKTLTDEQKSNVINSIVNNFNDWDDIRKNQIEIYRKLKKEIYLEERRSDRAKKDWQSDRKTNKIHSFFKTRQAYIWNNTYADMSKMFDVEGTNEESEENAKLQKFSLSNSFYKMKLNKQYDVAIEHLDTIGEACLFVAWKKIYKQVRRSNGIMDAIVDNKNIIKLKAGSEKSIFNILEYDDAYVTAINPINLVFDPSINPDIPEQWDRGGKIIKSWKTYNQIKSNEYYSLSKEELNDIKSMISDSNVREVTETDKKIEDIIDEDKIEVLEYWGDLSVDNKNLTNMCVCVIGRKYLAKFEDNPYIINPIINGATQRNPDTFRGIPTLWSIYDIAMSQEDDINEVKDVQQLNKNPARLTPRKFFQEKVLELETGKIIEYNQELEDPKGIIEIKPPLLDADRQIQYANDQMAEVSGIYPNMQGSAESSDVTATEIKVKTVGQSTRYSRDLDLIKQNIIIPTCEKVAELKANEQSGSEEIYVKENGVKVTKVITDDIRVGKYDYKYTDSDALITKESNWNKAMQLFMGASQNQELAQSIDWKTVFVEGLNMAGIENTDKYFKQDAANELVEAFNNLSPEFQEYIKMSISNLLSQQEGVKDINTTMNYNMNIEESLANGQ